jgi:hypothetical protein
MLYAVSAKLIPNRGPEFHTRLTDGSIAAQRPDGAEIVAAMQRARVAPDGTVRWTEVCYCPTPLQHERITVLDRYFIGIETKPRTSPDLDGAPLMDRLAVGGELEDRGEAKVTTWASPDASAPFAWKTKKS